MYLTTTRLNMANDKKPTNLIPITQWGCHHSWPPQGGLRHLVFNAEKNGFYKVIRRVGRRVLIDEQAFFLWVDEQNEGGEQDEK